MLYGSCIWSSGSDAVYDLQSYFEMSKQAWVAIAPHLPPGERSELWSMRDTMETVQAWATPDPVLLAPGSICLTTGCRVYYDTALGNEVRYVINRDAINRPSPYASLFVHREAIRQYIARRETNKFPVISIESITVDPTEEET
jgi:hypothetical protein